MSYKFLLPDWFDTEEFPLCPAFLIANVGSIVPFIIRVYIGSVPADVQKEAEKPYDFGIYVKEDDYPLIDFRYTLAFINDPWFKTDDLRRYVEVVHKIAEGPEDEKPEHIHFIRVVEAPEEEEVHKLPFVVPANMWN